MHSALTPRAQGAFLPEQAGLLSSRVAPNEGPGLIPTPDVQARYDAPIPDHDAISVLEAAVRLGVRHDTVYRQLRLGHFPCRAQKHGHQWRIDGADVDRYVAMTQEGCP